MTEQSPTATRDRLPIRKLVAASVGNAIEWYDYHGSQLGQPERGLRLRSEH